MRPVILTLLILQACDTSRDGGKTPTALSRLPAHSGEVSLVENENSKNAPKLIVLETPVDSQHKARANYSILSSTYKVRAAYRQFMGREPGVFEQSWWLRNSIPGVPIDLYVALLSSDAFYAAAGGSAIGFVNQLYRIVFGIKVDAAVANSVANRIVNGSITRASFARDVFTGCDYAGLLADEAYRALLLRPAPAGSAAVWCPAVKIGRVADLWLDLLASNEYYSRYESSAEGFVRGLYRDLLDRDGSNSEVSQSAGRLINGTVSRRQLARMFLESGEFAAYHVEICPNRFVDTTGHLSVDANLNACIASVKYQLLLPAGFYFVQSGLTVKRSSFFLGTENLVGNRVVCEQQTAECARLVAPSWGGPQPVISVGGQLKRVQLDHIIVDGNRDRRAESLRGHCNDGSGGRNIIFHVGDNHSLTNSASVNNVCGTALGVGISDGSEKKISYDVLIGSNYIANNGVDTRFDNGMWSDGLTAVNLSRAKVVYNTFVNNTDVALILGQSPGSDVSYNVIRQPDRYAFAAFMLTNWNVFLPAGGWSDDRGLVVSNNIIDCGENCDIGMQIGLDPWLPEGPGSPPYPFLRTMGARLERNSVVAYKQGINFCLAGTADFPVKMVSNIVSRGGYGAVRENTPVLLFARDSSPNNRMKSTSAINVCRPWDFSFVDVGGENPTLTAYPW